MLQRLRIPGAKHPIPAPECAPIIHDLVVAAFVHQTGVSSAGLAAAEHLGSFTYQDFLHSKKEKV
jgi:hypothetical protein